MVKLLKTLVGMRGFEPPTPYSRIMTDVFNFTTQITEKVQVRCDLSHPEITPIWVILRDFPLHLVITVLIRYQSATKN